MSRVRSLEVKYPTQGLEKRERNKDGINWIRSFGGKLKAEGSRVF
jgi:hypothetical protein